jgi:hypothetical protein
MCGRAGATCAATARGNLRCCEMRPQLADGCVEMQALAVAVPRDGWWRSAGGALNALPRAATGTQSKFTSGLGVVGSVSARWHGGGPACAPSLDRAGVRVESPFRALHADWAGPAVGAADQGVERRQQQGQAMKAMHASEALDHQPPDAAHARTTRPRDTADQMACHSAGTCTGTGRCSNGGDLCYFRAQLRAAGGALALSGRLLRPPCAV